MALADMLKQQGGKVRIEDIDLTRERIVDNLDIYRKQIAFWRQYPDLFIDYLCSINPHNTFHFYFYQRMFLRAIMRHRYVYGTFVRAWSKSFMSVLALVLKAILFPGAKLFVASG